MHCSTSWLLPHRRKDGRARGGALVEDDGSRTTRDCPHQKEDDMGPRIKICMEKNFCHEEIDLSPMRAETSGASGSGVDVHSRDESQLSTRSTRPANSAIVRKCTTFQDTTAKPSDRRQEVRSSHQTLCFCMRCRSSASATRPANDSDRPCTMASSLNFKYRRNSVLCHSSTV